MKEKTARSCDENNKHEFIMAACTKLLFPSDKTVVEAKETDVNKQTANTRCSRWFSFPHRGIRDEEFKL